MKVDSIILNYKIKHIKQNRQIVKNNNSYDNVSFKGLLADDKKDKIKMCVYDLDETLLNGLQPVRDKIIKFSKDKNRKLIYASARPLKQVTSLIKDGTLAMPDYYVGDNGLNIYKKQNGQLEEIKSWSNSLAKNFSKEKIREFMIDISNENKFDIPRHVEKIGAYVPLGKEAYRDSKISEYEVAFSPLNIYFMMAPGIFDKTKYQIEKNLKDKNIEADINFQNFAKRTLEPETLSKYFSPRVAIDMLNTAIPRLNQDGSIDVAIITAKSNKGKAVEFLRKQLNIERNEVLAAGDAENDFSNTNKGYVFALLANATEGLRNLVSKLPDTQKIINTTKEGVEGIWEVIGD